MKELMQFLSSPVPPMPILQEGQYVCRRGELLLQWFALLFPPSKCPPTEPFESDYPVFQFGRGEGDGMQVGLDMGALQTLKTALEEDRNLYDQEQERHKAAWCGKLARGLAANLRQLRIAAYNTEDMYRLVSPSTMLALNVLGLGLAGVKAAMLSRMNMSCGMQMVSALYDDVFGFLEEELSDRALVWPAQDEATSQTFESYL